VIRLLASVSDDAEALPPCVRLENVHLKKTQVLDRGNSRGEIAKGEYKGTLVAIKTIRLGSGMNSSLQRKVCVLAEAGFI
jgi:hypothetical protein